MLTQRYFCPTCRVQYGAPGACRRCNVQLKECGQCPSGGIEEAMMAKPAIRMQAIKIIGWGCLGLVIGSILTLAGGLTWRNHRDEVGALAISVLGMVILLGAVWRVLVGAFQAVSGRRTRVAIETLRLPAESATSMAGSEHAVASSSPSGKRDEATTAFSAFNSTQGPMTMADEQQRDKAIAIYQVTVPPDAVQGLRWPNECHHCGAVLPKPPLAHNQMKFAGRQSVPCLLCAKCDWRHNAWGKLSNVAGLLVFLAFVGPVFLRMNSPEQMRGAGGCFCLGALLGAYADRRRKKLASGVRGRVTRAGQLIIGFRDGGLCERFCSLNRTAYERVAAPGSRRLAILLLVLGGVLVAATLFAGMSANKAEAGMGVYVVLLCLGVLSMLIGALRYRAVKRLSKPCGAENSMGRGIGLTNG